MAVGSAVVVIGAGAVGLSSAYYLRRSGYEVTVVDPAPPGTKASGHNAGWLIPSMSTPVPAPGMMLQVMKWMTKRDSPLYVSPSLNPRFVGFMLQMLRSCTPKQFHQGSKVLAELSSGALELFDELVSDGLQFEMHQKPLTMLFTDPHKRDIRVGELELLDGKLPGLTWQHLEASELSTYSPTLNDAVIGGIRSQGDRTVDPDSFVQSLLAACEREGVDLRLGKEAVLEGGKGGTPAVRVGTEQIRADRIVVAAGAWTNRVLAGIDERVTLQTGKGYGYDLPVVDEGPAEPLYLAEAKVAITPLDSKVRLAGTMGFGGIDESIKQVRAGGILTGTSSYFQKWPSVDPAPKPWTGLRPMTPDGVPIIGPLRKHSNVLVATGHAMLGISLAPVTGRLVTELVTGETRPNSLPNLLPTRF